MPTVPALWNIIKFTHFLKVHQIASNLQNILGSAPETCMWKLSPFREIKNFREKCWECRHFEILWILHIFSKLNKFYKTCRIYRDKHLKPACEIRSIQRSKTFSWKNADSAGTLKYYEIYTSSKSSPNVIKLAEWIGSASETCMWNLSAFSEVKIFRKKKCWQCLHFEYYEMSTSSQNSRNSIKLAEYIGLSIWNLPVKVEPIQRS